MLKIIRPAGAMVFLVVITAIGLVWWLLADWLVKASIESVGTKAVGARVELASANLTFSPLGFRLQNLQVTNPKQPMQNMIQFDQLVGSLELEPLLMGLVIIKEMSATGIRLDTVRQKSGAIQKSRTETQSEQPSTQRSKQDSSTEKDSLPSIDEILAKESISTLDNIKALDDHIKTERTDFDKNLAALPDEAKLKQHEKRIKELSEAKVKSVEELKTRKQELNTVKNDIRSDRDTLKKVRQQLKNAKGELKQQYEALKNSPTEDWDKIKSRYGLDASGANNITGLLFGESAQLWLTRLLAWAQQAQSLLPGDDGNNTPKSLPPPRGTGRYIKFATANPLPDFLIRKAKLSLEIPAGNIDLEVNDATNQPHILGRPMRLHTSGSNLKNAGSVKIDGVFDHVKPHATKDTITWSLSGYKMSDVSISKSSSLPLTLSSALSDFTGNIELKGKVLTANVDAKFNNANWSSTATEGMTGRIAKSITSIRQFDLLGKLQGTLSSPKLSLRSDLDQQLKEAVSGQLKSAQNELEAKFKARLNDKITSMADPSKEHLAFLTDKENSLEQRINRLEKMLKTELKSATDTKKQEVKDKLKDKLKGFKF
ncbi:MAG: TIGR03545 family protein [Gammaproteobacteria bacterium]|nr:TIGR03545 family protein [Gammaproteobacteria bacterium]MDH5800428.1 TIGR03545 family protein [Gammaproteobacteria bacterium]